MYLMMQPSIHNMLFYVIVPTLTRVIGAQTHHFYIQHFPPFWHRFHVVPSVRLFAENSQLYLNIPNTYHRQINFIADK